jgi:hypothetical protein
MAGEWADDNLSAARRTDNERMTGECAEDNQITMRHVADESIAVDSADNDGMVAEHMDNERPHFRMEDESPPLFKVDDT